MRTLKLLLIIAIAGHFGCAQANILDQSLNGMFSNVTSPASINNGVRGSLIGGSVYIRAPNASINPFVIDPPRFSAGCGGIDATLGGFSYISADKLSQFFRKVIQQAAPVAFKLALQQFSPQLSQMLSDFQTWAQNMSSLSANSCQLATGVVQSGIDALSSLTNQAQNSGAQSLANTGDFQDAAEAAGNFIANPGAYFSKVFTSAPQKSASGNTIVADPNQGNVTWNALSKKEDTLGFDFGLDSDPVLSQEIIMSIIGTRIFAQSSQLSSGGENTDPKQPGILANWEDGTLRLRDLVNVNPDKQIITIIKCNDPQTGCISTRKADQSYAGFNGYIRTMFFGSPNNTNTYSSTSIIGSLTSSGTSACNPSVSNCNNANPVGFSSSQIQFLNSISHIPVMAYLKRTQHDPAWAISVTNSLMDVIVAEASYQYGEHIMKIIKSVYNGTGAKKPEKYDERMRDLAEDIAYFRGVADKGIEKQNAVLKNIDQIYLSSPELAAWRKRMGKGG